MQCTSCPDTWIFSASVSPWTWHRLPLLSATILGARYGAVRPWTRPMPYQSWLFFSDGPLSPAASFWDLHPFQPEHVRSRYTAAGIHSIGDMLNPIIGTWFVIPHLPPLPLKDIVPPGVLVLLRPEQCWHVTGSSIIFEIHALWYGTLSRIVILEVNDSQDHNSEYMSVRHSFLTIYHKFPVKSIIISIYINLG